MKLGRLVTRLVLLGVPRHLRDSIHGDLLETEAGCGEALRIALDFQADLYRCAPDRRCALLLALASAALMVSIPLATQSLLAQAAAVGEAFGRIAGMLWGAPLLVAAVACGVLVGRWSVLPARLDAIRLHVVFALMPVAAWQAPSDHQALASIALLVASAWIGMKSVQQSSAVLTVCAP